MGTRVVNLFIFFCIITWGSSYVFVEIGLHEFSPSQIASYRFIIASLTMLPVVFLKKIRIPTLKEGLVLCVISTVGVATYHIALNVSTLHYSANSVSFVANSLPIFITVISGILLKERTPLLGWISLLIGLIGVAILNYNDGFDFEWSTIVLLVIPLSSSLFFILQKPLLKTLEPYEVMFYTILIGSLILVLFDSSLIEKAFESSFISNLSIIYLGVVPTAISYNLWAYVLTKMDVSAASRYIYLVPVFTMFFSFFMLGELPSFNSFLGGSVILSGVYLSQLK